jgi:dTDP-4-amino-4,6-dideoxygalactose transaminase
MHLPLRYLAPAGSPVSTSDLLRWCATMLSGKPAATALQMEMRRRFDVRHVFLTATGRAGMTLLLRGMRRLAGDSRNEVVIPSYTCYSVPASIIKAGLRPRIADISPETLDYAPDALDQTDFSRVLAIVSTNLYGLTGDLPALDRLARRHGIFLIDDAAQSLGATVGGRWSGTWGDAGLFSLDKGKNISAIDGGILVTNSDALAAALAPEVAGLAAPGPLTSVQHVVKALAYFALLRPWLYGIPARIPQLGLGRTVFTTDFPLTSADDVLVALGVTMLRRLEEFTAARRANASALLAALNGAGITIAPVAGSTPVYLRLPLLMPSARDRDAALRALTAAGVGATRSYPESIADIPEIGEYLVGAGDRVAAGGRVVARRIVTLPTHPFVTAADVRRIRTTLDHAFDGAALGNPHTA